MAVNRLIASHRMRRRVAGTTLAEHVFLVAQTGAGHDFVRGFFGDHVHHVVDGDAAQQAPGFIHHRGGHQVAVAEQLRHLARRHIRRDARRFGVERGADRSCPDRR